MSEEALTDDESVHAYVGMICFKTGPPHKVGAEVEHIVAPTHHPQHHLSPTTLDDVLRDAEPLPAGSSITVEPGGQLELSSPVAPNLSHCWRGLERDLARLEDVLSDHDLRSTPVALDPIRPPRRLLDTPRYTAMQEYFDRRSDAGLVMMTGTAAIQINLDAGADDLDVARRWALLHALGPPLVAAFANSPMHLGHVTGWKSTRHRVLLAMDPGPLPAPTAPDPAAAWAEYALDVPVMMRRRPGRWLSAPGFTFREWINGRAGIAAPTTDDLDYHLTTLFPPVRPRGWLEVRYLDAQPREWWPVPLAVLAALMNDPTAADTAREATASRPHDWERAARHGLADPQLREAAVRCFEAALAALPRLHADPPLIRIVAAYYEHFVARGRCPADDFLDKHIGRDDLVRRGHQLPLLTVERS